MRDDEQIIPRAWRCTHPGCRATGAGYGSQHQANHAKRHHLDRAHGITAASAF